MKILWLSWMDRKNPHSGGAEIVKEGIAKKLVKKGFEIIFLTSGFNDAKREEIINGYKVVRVGKLLSVYYKAYQYYKRNLQAWSDLVIEEINLLPFFTSLYIKKRRLLFFHEVYRTLWFNTARFPFNLIIYFLESIYLRLLSDNQVITISKSTRDDLVRFGFKPKNIHIISEGIEIEPVRSLDYVKKYSQFTLLSLSALKIRKRTIDQILAFEIAKKAIPELKLKIAGVCDDKYGLKILKRITKSPYVKDIEYLGQVSKEKKIDLMRKCHLIMSTSVKEGWGLIITEANSQGTPAVTYDVHGLRDSIKHLKTGLLCKKNIPSELAKNIIRLCQDKKLYNRLQRTAWEWSKKITFNQSCQDLLRVLKRI